MSTNGARAAIYLRVSRDDQTTENQRLVLAKVADHRGWLIVQTYEDQGISGAKGRDQRPAFDTMLKDAVRRRFDVLMVWSIDRLGRSLPRCECPRRTRCCRRGALFRPTGHRQHHAYGTRHDPDGIGVRRASVREQERQIIRSRVLAGLDRVRQQGKKLGRPKVPPRSRTPSASI